MLLMICGWVVIGLVAVLWKKIFGSVIWSIIFVLFFLVFVIFWVVMKIFCRKLVFSCGVLIFVVWV